MPQICAYSLGRFPSSRTQIGTQRECKRSRFPGARHRFSRSSSTKSLRTMKFAALSSRCESSFLPFGRRLGLDANAFLHAIRGINHDLVAVSKSGSHVQLCSQISAHVDLLEVNDVVVNDGHELSLRPRDHAVTRNQNTGVLNVEMKLHGSEHSRAQALLGVLYLDFQQQRSSMLTERVAAASDLSVELLTRHLGKCERGFLPGLHAHCILLRNTDKCSKIMHVRDLEEFAPLRAASGWPTRIRLDGGRVCGQALACPDTRDQTANFDVTGCHRSINRRTHLLVGGEHGPMLKSRGRGAHVVFRCRYPVCRSL